MYVILRFSLIEIPGLDSIPVLSRIVHADYWEGPSLRTGHCTCKLGPDHGSLPCATDPERSPRYLIGFNTSRKTN